MYAFPGPHRFFTISLKALLPIAEAYLLATSLPMESTSLAQEAARYALSLPCPSNSTAKSLTAFLLCEI